MKKNYIKKSISLVMAVLMVLSCWVWIAPEHNHASAVYNIDTVTSNNSNAITNLTLNTDVTTIHGKFELDSDYLGTEYYDAIYKNVLYTDGAVTISASASSAKTEYGSSWTGSNGVTVYWYHPTATVMYDGETTPSLGVAVNTVMYYSGTWSRKTVNRLSWVSSGGNGFEFNTNWKGSDGRLNFNYMWHGQSAMMGYTSSVTNDSLKQTLSGNSDNHFYANLLKFTASMSDTEYYRTAKPTFSFYGDNGSTGKTISATSGDTLAVINYKPLKAAINEAIALKKQFTEGNLSYSDYTPESVARYVELANALMAAKPNNYVSSSKNDYAGYAKAASDAVTAWNDWHKDNTTGGLVKIKKVTWKDGDDKVLSSGYYAITENPTYSGTPTKSGSGHYDSEKGWQYTYTFNNTWTKTVEENGLDEIYTANFDEKANYYVITFIHIDTAGTTVIKLFESDYEIQPKDLPAFTEREPNEQGHAANFWEPAIEKVTSDKTYEENIGTAEHNWGEWVTTTNPTCSDQGSKEAACTDCGYKKYDIIAATEKHTYKLIEAVDSTCSKEGNNAYYQCESCSKYFYEEDPNTGFDDPTKDVKIVIPTKKHVLKSQYTIETDKHYIECVNCDYREKEEAHNHLHLNDFFDKKPTCTEEGYEVYVCTCGDQRTVTIDKDLSKHTDIVELDGTPGTCTEPGKSGDRICKACGTTISVGASTDPLGHSFTDYKSNGNATCTENGTETAKCDRCDATDTRVDEDSALGHNWTETETYLKSAANCTNNEVYYKECSRCNISSEDKTNETWEKANTKWNHKFNGAYVSNDNGTHVQKCTNADCTATGNESGCTYGSWSTDNDTTHSHTCTACNYTPAAENHDFTKWTHNDENAGNMTRKCKVCGREESTECKYESVDTAATCVDNAFTTYTCVECGHGYTEITGAATGHNFSGAYKYDADADKHQQLCANSCGTYGVGTVAGEWANCSWSYENSGSGKHTASCVCGNSEEQSCSGGQATCAAQAECQYCKTAYGEKSAHSFKGTVVVLEGDYHAFRCEYCIDQTIYGVGSKENDKAACSGGTATCTTLAVCDTCKDSYGELNADAHKWGAPESNKDSKHTHTYTCEYNRAHTKIEDCAPTVDHVVPPTCENAGYTVQKCTACSVTWNTDPVGALGHEWGAWVTNNNGTHTKTCVRSGCCYGENGAAKTQTASCTKENATVVVTAPTCTEEGYSTYTCKDCGYVWVADKVNAKGHDYTKKIYREEYLYRPQDCVNPNIYFYACSSCGKNGKYEEDENKYTNLTFEADKPLGHKWVEKIADEYKISDATCTTAAKYYKSCSVCSIKSEESFTVTEAFGHSNWVKPTAAEIEARKELLAVKADCETDAQYYYVCELCRVSSKGLKTDDETWTVVSDKPGHSTFVEVTGVVGNCENDTIIAHYYCSACGKKFKDADGNEAFVGDTVIKAPGHSWVKYKAVDATCEEDGHDAYDMCSVCDAVKGNKVTYPKTGHNFTADAGYFVDEVNDYHAFYCANAKCLPATDDNGEAVKDAKGRSVYNKAYGIVVDGVQVKYAVTDGEVVGGIQCSFDSSTITTVNGVHSHNDVCVCGNAISTVYTCENPEVVAPKCVDNGYTRHTCPECKATWQTDIVAATGHTMSTTGQSNGDGTHSIQCTVENCGYKKDTVRCQGGTATCKVQAVCEICNGAYGDKLPHTLDGEWTYNNDAKCGRDGTESQTCSVSGCGETVTRTKAGSALNHEYLPEYTYDISGWASKPTDFNHTLKEPNCKENGLAINYCTNAGCGHYNTKIIKASSVYHKFSVSTTSGTCTTGSVTIKTCTVCNYTERTESAAADHQWSETGRALPDCTINGRIYYVCTSCGDKAELNVITADFTDSDYVTFKGMTVDISGIKAKGHQWGNLAIERQATCSREGKAKHICQVEGCGKEETVTLKVIEGAHIIGHQNSTLKKVPASEPTCVLSGNREYYECMTCPYSQNANNEYYLKPLAHSDNDGDGRCDNCYDPMGNAPAIDDGCICHKSGFSAFIYKILKVFWKLFKINKSCACGAVHY